MEFDTSSQQYINGDENTFAFEFATKLLPITIDQIIEDVQLTLEETAEVAIKQEGEVIIQQLGTLKDIMRDNLPLVPLEDDGSGDIPSYNIELEKRGAPKWLDAPWLFSGCYLYRRIPNYFRISKYWKTYDVFRRRKLLSFKSSRSAVLELAAQYRTIVSNLQDNHKIEGVESQEQLEQAEEILFIEMAEICLWGNKTDLSLHTSLTEEDIQKLQGSKVRKASEQKILVNDLTKAFHVLNKALRAGQTERRVDIVLDNSGFELFVDLILAGYLLSTGLATTVVLHPKNMPWFVSDVVPQDFTDMLESLGNAKSFFQSATAEQSATTLSEADLKNLSFLHENWASFYSSGKLRIQTHRFWTDGGSHWRLPRTALDLYEDLKKSELVMFKGDLNYRKLIADVIWDPTTPFEKALGPLGPGSGLRILALRTCKADVVCGLPNGKDEELRKQQPGGPGPKRTWAWPGEWAVIQFSDGK